MEKWKVALFDLDGTLLSTEQQYSEFWGRMGRVYRPDVPDFAHIIKGTTLTQILSRFFPDQDLQREIEEKIDAWEEQMAYPFFPGAEAFVENLRSHGIRCAVVTSSNQKKMACVRNYLPQFDHLFERVLTSEDFSASKPHPDCYLKGAAAMGVGVEECVVFEDAFTGLQAGVSAGMLTVGMATTNSREQIRDHCHVVYDSFDRLDYETVNREFQQFISNE